MIIRRVGTYDLVSGKNFSLEALRHEPQASAAPSATRPFELLRRLGIECPS